MATYTNADFSPRSKYFVSEVNCHIRVEDIDRWSKTRDWSWVESLHEFKNEKEAEDFVRRTNAEGDKIIEDVKRKGEDSKYVEEGERAFYIKYVFDPIEQVKGDARLNEGDSFNGDTFKNISRLPLYLRGMTFKNCKFIGEGFALRYCKLFNCTFSGVKSIEIISSRFEECDFTQSSNILLDVEKKSDFIRCEFDEARLKLHSWSHLEDLSGTSGLSAWQTDPELFRRRRLSEDQLTVEELASIRGGGLWGRGFRRQKIEILTRRVSKAKGDKELEALAQEVGSLQAKPQYVHEHREVLEGLQAEIERKYSLIGKANRYLKRLFSRGRKASQIRVASEMNRELQREIRALKRDLNK